MEQDISQFDPTVAELQTLVTITSGLQYVAGDKEQIKKVKDARVSIRDARIKITEKGKELREGAIKFQKLVIEKEKELIAVIQPEELRLKGIEEQFKADQERAERVALLPMRRAKVTELGFVISDEILLNVSAEELQALLNQKIAEKNEADRLANEAKDKELKDKEDALLRESQTREREEKARQDERDRIEREQGERVEKERKEKIAKRIEELTSMGLKYEPTQNAYTLEDFYFPMLDIQTYDDELWSRSVVKVENEIQNRKAKAEEEAEAKRIEQERIEFEKREAFITWLKTQGWTEETKQDYLISYSADKTKVKLYKLLGEYNDN